MGTFMKTGSIYTDMIKPLERELYNIIRHHENDERQRLDELYPHLRNIQYNSNKLQHLSNLREIVPVAVETVVKTAAWKDVRVEDVCLASFISGFCNADKSANTLACLFEFDFSDGSKLKMLPTQVGWTPPNVKVTEYLSEWSSVVKGEMTVDAFVELLKNKSHGRIPWVSDVPETKQISKRPVGEALEGGTFVTGSLDTVPCVISHPGTGIHFSGSKEDAINFLLEELIRAKEGSRNTEPGHIFAIEPYNRAKHGDEIDILMDDKGTTQRFKIGEDGQPIFPKSEAKGTGADGVTEGFMTFVQNTNTMVRRWASARASSIINRIGMSPTELCAPLARDDHYQINELLRTEIISSEERWQIYDAMKLLKDWAVISPVTGSFLGNVDAPFEKALQVAISRESLSIKD